MDKDLKLHFIKNNLLNFGGNTKIDKNEIPTYNLSLLPHSMNSKKINLCTHSTKECRTLCLNMSGRGAFNSVQRSRELRTEFYINNKREFLIILLSELARINTVQSKALIRLNTFSDINWREEFKILNVNMEHFDNLIFYDYTKVPEIIIGKAKNQEIVFSFSGKNSRDCLSFLEKKLCNVAVVFEKEIPEKFWGFPVLNGDDSDQRLSSIEGTGKIIGLKFKKPRIKDKVEFKTFVI